MPTAFPAAGEVELRDAAAMIHNVYFTLRDSSPEACERMVAACRHYLQGHPGELLFSVGRRIEDLAREVNDRDYHVSLHIAFRTRADQDAYQTAPRHLEFIAENRDNWAKVRVFDSQICG